MRVEPIDQHRGHIATLAALHHAEWGHLYEHWTADVARAEFEDHSSRRGVPTTLVLLDGNLLLGSVSVVLEDAPELSAEGSPWLASLYVVPEARGRGLGSMLVAAAVELAAKQDVRHLFLFTPDRAGFYERLGWRLLARTALKGTPVDLMQIEPA